MKRKFIKELRLFMFLKLECSGHFKDCAKSKAMAQLNIKSPKTFRKQFKWLLRNRWITVNATRGYRLQSMKRLYKRYQIKSITDVLFNAQHLNDFEVFVAASMIGNSINVMRRKKWLSESKMDRIKRKSDSSMNDPFSPDYFGLSINLIAKMFDCSPTKALTLKKRANDLQLIIVKNRFIETGFLSGELDAFKRAYPEYGARARFLKGEIFIQSYDEIIPRLTYKSRYVGKEVKASI